MTTTPDDAIRRGRLCAWPYVLLCVAAWLFIWKGIEPAQLYHHQTPVFMTGWDYLATSWASGAGGLIEYAGAGLTQTYHRPWLGALILAILLGSVVFLSNRWLKYVTYRSCLFSGFVPAALLLTMLNGRALPIAPILALVLALLAAVVFGLVVTTSRWAAPVAMVLLSLLLYPVVAGPYLFFVALAVLHAALRRRFLLVGLGVLLAGAIPYFIGVCWWHCGVYDAWLRNLLFEYDLNPQVLSIAIYAFYPLAVVLLAIGSVWMRRRAKAPASASASVSKAPAASAGFASTGGSRHHVGTSGTRRRNESRQPKAAPVPLFWRRMLAGTGAVAVFAAGSLWVFRDALATTILRVDRYAREREWEQVLVAAGPLQWSEMDSAAELERLVFLPFLTPR
ncbi:MAG: hypothetical protein JXA69_18985, partial [Phycisphaerae bacterium]|nr:hypothetical protein [Phycisphaerae bacterium]